MKSVMSKSSVVRIIGRLVIISLGVSSMIATALGQTNPVVRETPAQLQQLVAPIALYPDELVAQILTASTFPTQIVAADRWLGTNSELQGEQLAAQVDQQSWDASVKALTAFPSVVSNMDMNWQWTTALGQAYLNQQQDVLDAVQVMRERAQAAGNLQSTSQQNVTTQGSTIVIQPAVPDTCYLPYYDPWIVYGTPLDVYPGYIYTPWYGPPFIAFGPGIGVGFFGRFGWGWPAWGFNWNRRVVVFNRSPYGFRSPGFVRGYGFRSGFRPAPNFHHSFGNARTFRGFGRHR